MLEDICTRVHDFVRRGVDTQDDDARCVLFAAAREQYELLHALTTDAGPGMETEDHG